MYYRTFSAQLSSVSANINNGTFTNNRGISSGGGMHAEQNKLLTLTSLNFVNSTVSEGGCPLLSRYNYSGVSGGSCTALYLLETHYYDCRHRWGSLSDVECEWDGLQLHLHWQLSRSVKGHRYTAPARGLPLSRAMLTCSCSL